MSWFSPVILRLVRRLPSRPTDLHLLYRPTDLHLLYRFMRRHLLSRLMGRLSNRMSFFAVTLLPTFRLQLNCLACSAMRFHLMGRLHCILSNH